MTSSGLRALPALVFAGALTFACSQSALSGFGAESGPGGDTSREPGDGSDDKVGAANASPPELVPTDNAVIVVHAAGMPAFRICFENEPDLYPMPDRQTMPDANVVGVEVGSAVRLAPLAKGAPGKVWLFDEPLIREFPGGNSVTCGDLMTGTFAKYGRQMTAITSDYSRGVHLLVVRGCQSQTAITYTKEQCGEDYDPATGNLSLLDTELTGAKRKGNELPTQVIHLSQAVETAKGTGTLTVSFGDVKTTESVHTSIASAPPLFGAPLSLAASPAFDPADDAVYAEVGFRVSVTNGSDPATVIAQQSLADVQRLSAPREIPSTYYGAASNYVLLLLGTPDAKLPDGGADTNPRKNVHLLAVPVIDPKDDAGAPDAGAANDGGPAPDGAL